MHKMQQLLLYEKSQELRLPDNPKAADAETMHVQIKLIYITLSISMSRKILWLSDIPRHRYRRLVRKQIYFPNPRLHVAGFDGLNQGLHRVTGRSIFVGHVPVIVSFGNRSHNSRVVNLLVLVKLVTARDTGSMNVAYVFDVLTYCGNQVTFHNLHVVNVIEHFEPG